MFLPTTTICCSYDFAKRQGKCMAPTTGKYRYKYSELSCVTRRVFMFLDRMPAVHMWEGQRKDCYLGLRSATCQPLKWWLTTKQSQIFVVPMQVVPVVYLPVWWSYFVYKGGVNGDTFTL